MNDNLKDHVDAAMQAAAQQAQGHPTVTSQFMLGTGKPAAFTLPADFDMIDFALFIEGVGHIAIQMMAKRAEQTAQQPGLIIKRSMPAGGALDG